MDIFWGREVSGTDAGLFLIINPTKNYLGERILIRNSLGQVGLYGQVSVWWWCGGGVF